jgi:hypothetical protein
MSRELPPRPHLGQYRKQAKDLLKVARAGDADAIARLRKHLPQTAVPPHTLGDAQLVIAREHGFASWARFKRHVEAQTPPGEPPAHAAPDGPSLSRAAPSGPLPRPNAATLRALTLAAEEARRLGQRYVGTEHLLLGLLGSPESAAMRLLRELVEDPQRIRVAVDHLLHPNPSSTTTADPDAPFQAPLTPRSHRVMGIAASSALHLDRSEVGTEHLLLALALEDAGIAANVLQSYGVTADQIRQRCAATPRSGEE